MSFESSGVVAGDRSPQGAGGDRGEAFSAPRVPNPEVVPRAARRTFTAQYKLDILRQVDACSGPNEVGALLRREGLYGSLVTKWRDQRNAGALETLSKRKRGRPARSDESREVERLRKALDRAQADLAKAHQVIEIQGKVSALLEGLLDVGADQTDKQSTK